MQVARSGAGKDRDLQGMQPKGYRVRLSRVWYYKNVRKETSYTLVHRSYHERIRQRNGRSRQSRGSVLRVRFYVPDGILKHFSITLLFTEENQMSKQRLSELIMIGYSSGLAVVAVMLALPPVL